ncbi:MAG: M91 family zinc metallopeptidase [Acidobacteriota bacterium]
MTYTVFAQEVEGRTRTATVITGIYVADEPGQPFFHAIVNEALSGLWEKPKGKALLQAIIGAGPVDYRGYRILISRVSISYEMALNGTIKPRGGRSYASPAQKQLGVASDAAQLHGEGVSALVGWCQNQVVYTPQVGANRKPHFVPPSVTLGHELIHGLHALNGDSKSGSTIKIDGKDTSEEEAFTVGLGIYANAIHTENKLREDFNLPPRLSYP